MIDVVIISDAKDDKLKAITQQAVNTSFQNEHKLKVSPIVVESNKAVTHQNCVTVHPGVEFNYNRYLNIGASYGTGNYIAFCNNDLIFKNNWASYLIDAMINYDCEAASPICPHTQNEFKVRPHTGVKRGMETRRHFAGWCFVLSRGLWERIGRLDERYKFWCSDNIVAEYQLPKHHASHILVTDSVVEHLGAGSKTLEMVKVIDPAKHTQFTEQCVKEWNRDFNDNKFGWGKAQ